jgi:hypothetical protein
MVESMFEDETTVAWQATPRHAPVTDAEGNEIGTVAELLGDEGDDIFHGIAVKRRHDGETVEISAARVKRVTTGHVVTDLSAAEASALPRYDRS